MLRRLSLVAAALLVSGCASDSATSDAAPVDCAVDKCVAFTFDDGPTPYTDRLLRVLHDAGAKATFFLIGNKVAANPDGAKRIAEAGMEIGNHTWEHPNMTTIPEQYVPAQLSKAQQAISAATGQTPKLWRPAGGLTNDAVNAVAALRKPTAILEAELKKTGGYLVGGRFTIADLNLAAVYSYAKPAPELFVDAPHVLAWLDGALERPAALAARNG